MKRYLIFISLFIFVFTSVKGEVKCGADKIEEILSIVDNKRVALIVNQTSITQNGTHIVDTLISRGVDIKKIFAPEHGFRGTADAGESISDGIDTKSGKKIISLYGKNKKPSADQLADVDMIIFDIQDVGARFYTYISTMYYAMQAATENSKEFVVLDRPNPNDHIDGPMLDMKFKSFVGTLPLPVMHGLTVGELANMIKGENWGETKNLKLQVITIDGWQHGNYYELMVKPSPNLPNMRSIIFYPSLCLFEGTAISVGRGTTSPFEMIGAPNRNLGTFTFTPKSLEGFDKNPMYKDKVCYGVNLKGESLPQGFQLKYLIGMYNKFGKQPSFFTNANFFDKLAGTSQLREDIIAGKSESEIRESWQEGLSLFKKLRSKYLIYPDNRF